MREKEKRCVDRIYERKCSLGMRFFFLYKRSIKVYGIFHLLCLTRERTCQILSENFYEDLKGRAQFDLRYRELV